MDHPGEDIVGGTVEDAADLQNGVGRHALTEGAQDGDAPTHAGLKEVDRLVLCRQSQQPAAVGRHQFLIRCHHTFARLQGPFCEVQGGPHAPDGLHHHLNFRIIFNHGKVLDKAAGKGAVRKLTDV